MRNGKIITARLWTRFEGDIPSRTPVILGVNPQKYETICIYLTKNSPNPNIFEQKGKKVFYITKNPELGFFKLKVFFKLAKILKSEYVDILDCHKHKSIVYGTIAGKLAKVPIILAHVHGIGRTRNLKRKLLNYFILRHVNRILAVGQAVKDDILRNNPLIKPEKVINLGNSIDYDKFSKVVKDDTLKKNKFGIEKNAFVFATAGRLAPTKGQKYLISAFAHVRKQLNDAELLIAGTGEMKNKLENLVSKLGCSSAVRFLGHVDNMTEFYSMTDVFVLSSVAEGLPRTLIEAMAAGVLCIATSTGGIPEILDNGSCGLLVPTKDTNALADAMLAAVNIPQCQKETIISSAKKHAKENFSHNVMIKKIEKIYETEINRLL
jgi:glycosyltransferase involved in cell wall biosynthesis